MLKFCCRYFIPEDGDDEKHPNCFLLEETKAVTLHIVKQVRFNFYASNIYYRVYIIYIL